MKAFNIPAIAILFAFFFILPFPVQAYSGGSGDPNNPYQIGSVADLLELAAETGDYNKCFILTADIDLGSLDPCTTAVIAPDTSNPNSTFDGTAFTGVFDGSNHTISNLIIDTNGAENDYLGLFGQISSGGEIKNLGLENVSITGEDTSFSLGGLAGASDGNISNCHSTGAITGGDNSYYLGGLAGAAGGTLSNCHSTSTVAGGNGSQHLGGLVGWNSGTISNCHSTGAVAGGNSSHYLGGLVGWNNSGNISNCYSTDDVSGGTVSYYLGGLVGVNYDTISNCYSTGAVTGTAYLGGLVGTSNGTIGSSFSTAAVTGQNGSSYIGGLAGLNSGSISNCFATGPVSSGNPSQYLGGLVGYNGNGASISNCYSTGAVSSGAGISNTGGLAGYSDGTITSCYFLTGSGLDNGIGTSLSASNIKKQASFSGWDFVNIWRIREDVSFPKLNMSSYSGGAGTSADPYRIGSVADLLAMAANTYDYDAYFILTADINLASYSFTTAVIAPDAENSNYSLEGTAFTGVFDGNNHTISNMTIDTNGAANDYLGLFGQIGADGEIKNLRLKDVNIIGGDNSSICLGGLAGFNDAGAVSNCFTAGNVIGGNHSEQLGGLVGENKDGDISSCYSTAAVTAGGDSYAVSGLVGGNYGDINNCFSTGRTSSGDNSYCLGGLVGDNFDSTISRCYSTGSVTGGDGSFQLGGLAGLNEDAAIDNCYSTGSITGGVGSYNLGGLAGWNNKNISCCYSSGSVIGGVDSNYLGGFVGKNYNDNINSCFFLNTSGPDNNVPGATPLTDKQMKQQKSFVGFDFVAGNADGTEDIWWINKGVSYPKLTWQVDVAKCTVTAGSKPNTDKISFSGTMGASDDDFSDPNSPIVKVTVDSKYLVNPCVHTFPIDANTFKKGKYNYSKTIGGVKKSFSYDTKIHKFSFSVSNINLSGFDCPAILLIEVGDYSGSAQMDEAIVNAKMPVPIKLMTGVRNILSVAKCTLKQGKKKPNTDQLTVSGGFTVEDPNMTMDDRTGADLVITLDSGTQTFTILADNLIPGKGKFSCTKANAVPSGVVAATFDFNKCSFTLTIKNTDIDDTLTGDVDFRIQFAGFDETDEVTLP